MVAHSDESLCFTIGEILARDGFSFQICHNGHEALRQMESAPPHLALVDVALPGLFAFEVVDKVRSRPALQAMKIILLSSVYNKTAYKRTPTSLYGADDYLEKHHIPTDLVPKINSLLIDVAPEPDHSPAPEETDSEQLLAARASAEEPRAFVDAINCKIRSAEEHEVFAESAAEAAEKARRLARIIVSDIALYNQEKVEEGIRTGHFSELLAREIEEGRRLFEERVAPEVRQLEDHLQSAFTALIDRRRSELRL
jgi:DNA-binding response OmpR family regulator